jgi:hypothetical protein
MLQGEHLLDYVLKKAKSCKLPNFSRATGITKYLVCSFVGNVILVNRRVPWKLLKMLLCHFNFKAIFVSQYCEKFVTEKNCLLNTLFI